MLATYLFSLVGSANEVLNQCFIKRMKSFTISVDALTNSAWCFNNTMVYSWILSSSLQRYSL